MSYFLWYLSRGSLGLSIILSTIDRIKVSRNKAMAISLMPVTIGYLHQKKGSKHLWWTD